MFPKQTIVFKTVDSVDMHANVYLPEHHSPERQYSAILYLHGGGMVIGNRDMIPKMQVDSFVQKDWIVVSADYRLIPETKFQDACQDVFDAYQWMRTVGKDLYGIDKDNIAIIGSSAGARLALLAGYMVNEPPKCLVSLYGQCNFDLNSVSWMSLRNIEVTQEQAFSAVYKHGIRTATTADSPDHEGYLNYLTWIVQKDKLQEAYFGENYDESLLQKYSPSMNVHNSYPPTFVIHGKKDTLTPFIHAETMYEALKKMDVKSELLLVEGEDHAFDVQWEVTDPKRLQDFTDSTLIPFIAQYFK
ncbi:Alpha/Beta hydrolase protein [Umbelopsis sp. PMI_123]|nr:Alpha/Beta hydrolase protein [Umbelopsis sp. PMI_123]